MTVWIYKGSRRAETYLYVPEENGFERVPAELLEVMGTLELVMELELNAERQLARVDTNDVMKGVEKVGYFPADAADRTGRQTPRFSSIVWQCRC